MIRCHDGHPNPPGSIFCSECGSLLPVPRNPVPRDPDPLPDPSQASSSSSGNQSCGSSSSGPRSSGPKCIVDGDPRLDPDSSASRPVVAKVPRFAITNVNGTEIPEETGLMVRIPWEMFLNGQTVWVGRSASPRPGYPPEADFGPYLQGHEPPYPLSRKSAVLYLQDERLYLRPLGSKPVYLKQPGQRSYFLVTTGTVVELKDGYVLHFGAPPRSIRAVVRLPNLAA